MTRSATHPCARMRRLAVLSALAVLPAGCMVGPDYQAPTPVTAAGFAADREKAAADAARTVAWWNEFHDEAMSKRILQALEKSPDIRQAAAKVKEARALAHAAGAALWPTVDAKTSYAYSSESPAVTGAPRVSSGVYRAGLDASWELDFWGGNQRGVEAAVADAHAAEMQAAAVRVSLAAETARQEILARGLAARLRVISDNLAAQNETLALATHRKDAGLTTEAPVAQAEAQLAGIEARVPPLRESLAGAENRLAVLMGEVPGTVHVAQKADGHFLASEVPSAPEPPPGLPADVLRRRPDLFAAEQALHAHTARIGVAEAELYPKFSLTGSIGTAGPQPGDLVNWANHYYSVGPSVQWRVFDRSRIKSQIAAAGAKAEGALAEYDKTVLTALEEVENALTAMDTNIVRMAALKKAVASSERSVALARQQYTDGLGDFLSVLVEQQRLFDAREQYEDAKTQQALNLVTLYKVLGGGW